MQQAFVMLPRWPFILFVILKISLLNYNNFPQQRGLLYVDTLILGMILASLDIILQRFIIISMVIIHESIIFYFRNKGIVVK